MKTESSWNSSSTVKPHEPASGARETKIDQFTAQVAENRLVSTGTHRIELSLPPMDCLRVAPGEFFMVRTSPSLDPLLRRPFSIHSIKPHQVEPQRRLSILFRVVGQGTRLMAGWTRGQPVDMIGPLGRGYTIPEEMGTAVIIAGGLGIASLFGLAESILQREKGADVRVYIGGKSKDDILMKPELERMGATIRTSTEDGSMGEMGVVTDWFEREGPHLAKNQKTVVYACGPLNMVARVAAITEKLSIPCQVSLEARMACGVGSCLGCAVRIRGRGYQMVCKDGPVFDADKIDWEKTKRLV